MNEDKNQRENESFWFFFAAGNIFSESERIAKSPWHFRLLMLRYI